MKLELMSVFIKDKDDRQLLININHNLEPTPQCCIYRVHTSLRKMNEEAYTPKMISIGPLHYGKDELADMEKHKIRYMESFLKQITIEKWEKMLTFIKCNEQRIRNCYAEISYLESVEFVAMILYDTVFLIEHLRSFNEPDCYVSDVLVKTLASSYQLQMDLLLLENQLPFFILEELYSIAYDHPTFTDLSCSYFKHEMFNITSPEAEIMHFTDLIRTALLKTHPKVKSNRHKIIDNLPCAVKLHESGVNFEVIEGECLLDIRFEKLKKRIPCFKTHELQIPCLKVNEDTKGILRNVMALEQLHYTFDTRVCNYAVLMDFLINTESDVDLLVGKEIITNRLGDNASITNMFNKLCLQISLSGSCYYDLSEELKVHFKNPVNHTKAFLKRVYFGNFWKGTATIAAIALLLLTIIQTICSILQVG